MEGRLTLQERLVVLVLAAVLPLAGLSVWFVSREVDSTTELARSQLRFTASAVAAAQDSVIDSVHHLLGAVVAIPEVRSQGSEACVRQLTALRNRYPIYGNMGIVDPQGRVLCLARGDIGAPDASEHLYFRRALDQRSFVMGEAAVGSATGNFSLAFAMPVLEGDRIASVVFAALDLDRAADVLEGMDLPQGAHVAIADRHGHVLMEYPATGQSVAGRRLQDPALLQAAQRLTASVGETADAQGQARIYAAAPSRPVAGEGLLAVVSLDRQQLTAASNERLARVLAVMAISLLAGLAAAWWIGGRAIVKPARQILGTARRLEQGNLDARVQVAQRNPRSEFSRIGAAFNLMAESLQLRQLDLEAELGRSRSAYAVLDTVLNSMQEGLIAVGPAGEFLIFNRAAARLFPMEGSRVPPEEWPRHFGLHTQASRELLQPQDMPFARAMRGEVGEMLVLVRAPRALRDRILRCNYTPMQNEDGAVTGGLVVLTDVTALEKAETDLVLLRNAVARLNDIVLITEAKPIDPPGPRIVFVNEAFERLTGYSEPEAIGNTPRMLQGPGTDRAALDRIRQALVQGRPVREELLNYTKDGRQLWLETDIVPMADETGHYSHLIAVQRDITARKQFEQQLLASERELQEFSGMLQRTAEAAQAIARHQALEQTMQEVVDQARRVIGAHRAVLSLGAGAQWAGALSESDAWREQGGEAPGLSEATGLYATVRDSGQPLRANGLLAVPLVDGRGDSIGLLQLSGKEQGNFGERDEYVAIELAQLASTAIENARLFGQIRELNASLESRIADRTAELVRQGRLYRALAEQLPEVVWNTDASGTRLTYLNRAWYELVGGSDADWLGKSGLAAIHPDDRDEVHANWERCRRALAPFVGIRRLRAADGGYHTMSYKGVPVLDESGEVAYWVGIDADITPLKAIEEALRASNQELEAFSYSVSHDLRAPLGAIDGFSKALNSRLEGKVDEKAMHYLSRIQAGVTKMEQLIEALLGLSRVARSQLQPAQVDLGAIARETLEGLQMQQPERSVTAQVEEGLQVQGDARLLRIVMENLLGNAWKFTARTPDAQIEVGKLAEGNVLFVRDNGVGFDMAYAGKLFSAFQRLHTDAEFPGTGIGLATVRRIVARHLGRVWVESAPGKGTTFFFTIPGSAGPWNGEPEAAEGGRS